jgi:CheY-like chemotaxis protein
MRTESGHQVDMLTREQFIKCLRDALNHLHDPVRLRRGPLAALFGVADRFDTSLALQRIMTEAIESLKPPDDEPYQSRSWRIYDSLRCCYVQQLGQHAVADQLGISTRQLRREQHIALEELADRLWQQFDLKVELVPGMSEHAAGTPAAMPSPGPDDELAWLKNSPPETPTDLEPALAESVDLVRPLATQHGVRLQVTSTDGSPMLAVHPVAFSQMLLNMLTVAIQRGPGGAVTVDARHLQWAVEIEVRCAGSGPGPQPPSDDEAASLDMAYRLAELSRGWLTHVFEVGAFSATLTLPELERWPVLVIDDNADTLQLLKRYASGTRYRLVSTQDPEEALALAGQIAPQIIVLDVMMPQTDGWRVLSQLRQHPVTGDIPVIVCTILAQEALALSLGASAFVRKPVTRQAFLAALDRQFEAAASTPR